jgi:hypothetical protein
LDAVIEAEPALAIMLSADGFDAALLAVGSFVDLKSPFFLGNSRAVADLAERAGASLGCNEAEVRTSLSTCARSMPVSRASSAEDGSRPRTWT